MQEPGDRDNSASTLTEAATRSSTPAVPSDNQMEEVASIEWMSRPPAEKTSSTNSAVEVTAKAAKPPEPIDTNNSTDGAKSSGPLVMNYTTKDGVKKKMMLKTLVTSNTTAKPKPHLPSTDPTNPDNVRARHVPQAVRTTFLFCLMFHLQCKTCTKLKL